MIDFMLFGGFGDGQTNERTDICTSWVAFATENCKIAKSGHQQGCAFGQVKYWKNFENLSIWGSLGGFGVIWICIIDISVKFGNIWYSIYLLKSIW